MADEPKTAIQGELYIQKQKGGPGFTGLITPYENPNDWYIQVFPNEHSYERYAVTYGLIITKEPINDPPHDSSEKRKSSPM